jgi:hypothetical protein
MPEETFTPAGIIDCGYNWRRGYSCALVLMPTKKQSAGRIYSSRRSFLWGDLSEVLLRGEPELDIAVFENDHERVGVTRVQIATVHVKLPVEYLRFWIRFIRGENRRSNVRGAFQFYFVTLTSAHPQAPALVVMRRRR